MDLPTNLRALPLDVDVEVEDLAAWLHSQSEAIQRVTRLVRGGGLLVQKPVIEEGAFVDPTAQLIGGMIVSRGCYVGAFAVVRLDEKPSPEPLLIRPETNIQDCAIMHSTTQEIGRRVIVAHQAVVHGAALEDEVTLYIQAVADGHGTTIGRGSFLHQGSYVGKGIRVPAGRYVAPGQHVLSQAEADSLPPVPDALRALSAHVLEHNLAHVSLHRRALKIHQEPWPLSG